MQRFLSVLLGLMLVVVCIPADAEETVVLTALWETGGTQMNEKNSVREAIKEATGIDLLCTSSAEYSTKLSTLIASHDLPDMFGTREDQAIQLRDNGYLMDMAPYLQQYAPNLWEKLKDSIMMSPLNEDGHVYGLVRAVTGYPSSLCVRSDYLEALNISIPNTVDEFYAALEAITNQDPDNDGQKNTYGIAYCMEQMRSFEYTFGAWGIAIGCPVVLEDGTVTTYMKHPRYLEVINFLRKCYQNGVMDPDFATVNTMDWFTKLWEGKVGFFDFQAVGPTNNWYPGRYTQEKTPTFDFAVIEGPYGDKGCVKQYPNVTNYPIAVSADCKHPEAVAKLLEYLNSDEGQILTNLGVEGLHFQWVDKENLVFERMPAFKEDAAHRADGGYLYFEMFSRYLPDNMEIRMLTPMTQKGLQIGAENPVDWAWMPVTLEAQNEYGSTLTDIEKQCLASLITTSGNVEDEYKAFVEQWELEGGLEYETEATEYYSNMNK